MRSTRLLPVLVVVAGLVALTSWWGGSARPEAENLVAPAVPVAAGPGALSSTWFCAAGVAGTPLPPKHSLILTNPSDEQVQASLSAFGREGLQGAKAVEVAPNGITRVDVGDTFGAPELSVMVESSSGELVVEHRLVTSGAADQVACATTSSDRWYFPSQDTAQVVREAGVVERTATAHLVLFNPFSSDAGVNVTASVEDGIRVPGPWQGIVVPAGTSRVIDLGTEVRRRDQFSLSVTARTGRVIAETVQSYTATAGNSAAGIRFQLGVPQAESHWGMAQGFTGQGVSERFVVFNPGEETASVLVQVTPVGGAEMPPEPFDVDVAPRRYRVVDLSAEGRVPGEGYHSIQVETAEDTPVVVGRVTMISGPPAAPAGQPAAEPPVVARPDLPRGTAIGTGTPLLSTTWVVPLVIVGGGQQPSVSVHNPGTGIVRVTATTFGADGKPVTIADQVEVQPGDGAVFSMADVDLPAGDVAVRVTATSPVLVERLVTFVDQSDLSMSLAVPMPPRAGGGFPLLGGL